jgi:anaerobic magnesium-protoporphyrin IX monomethyl ester cyclase
MNPPRHGGVALVYPYFREKDPVPNLFPPLGIAGLASQLRELGVPVRVHDCTFGTFSGIVGQIARNRPDVVAISCMVTMSRNAFDLLDALREKLPGTLFVAGGPLPTVHPAMFTGRFDAVFCGEGDLVFPRFCQDYLRSGCGPEDFTGMDTGNYPGLHVVVRGEVRSSLSIHNPSSVLDHLPLPDRSGFDHPRYQRAMEMATGYRQTSIMVTRGCPFSCDFCSKPVWGNDFRKPPLERVFREIDEIIALGYNCLWIADDCFTLDTGYLVEFCNAMIGRNNRISWMCLSRVDRIDPDLAQLMKRAGCIRVYLGLESASNETLRLMNKRVTVEQGSLAVRLFRNAGIGTAGFFMVGYPGETYESVEKTFALSLALPLDEIWFSIPLPLPGTPLFSRVADISAWEDWEVSNQVKFVYPTEFDTCLLRRRINETLETFRSKKGG